MPRGVIIFGSAGSGKTTLGRMTAARLGFPYFDLDDYIWRKDTPVPFTVMYSRDEKISRLMNDICRSERFVMGGSMSSFNQPFVPLFDLAVHLTAPTELRVERAHRRELERYGERVLEGGDMYEEHCRFLKSVAGYDTGEASPNLKGHLEWAATLPCKVIRLSGDAPLEENTRVIAEEYLRIAAAQNLTEVQP